MAINTRNDVFTQRAKGYGFHTPLISSALNPATSATNGSGFFTARIAVNLVGTTLPSTIQDFPLPTSLANPLMTALGVLGANINAYWLARIYKIGTLVLSATGNQFTHDAATFPVTRTQLGQASQPVTLLPYLLLTAATATTAPQFQLKTNAGGAGYVNQDGTSVVGTNTFTFPASATLNGSGFIIPVEQGDSGLQDITQINVSVAGTAGTAAIYGLELLMPLGMPSNDPMAAVCDPLTGGLGLVDLKPAVATTGTVTTNLVIFTNTTASNSGVCGWVHGVTT